jgi:hypothetical protein
VLVECTEGEEKLGEDTAVDQYKYFRLEGRKIIILSSLECLPLSGQLQSDIEKVCRKHTDTLQTLNKELPAQLHCPLQC